MRSVGLLPAAALLMGAAAATSLQLSADIAWWILPVAVIAAFAAYRFQQVPALVVFTAGACSIAGWALAADEQQHALDTPIRAVLDREFGGFDINTRGPGARHNPVRVRGVLVEDASYSGDLATLRMRLQNIDVGRGEERVDGQVTFSVGGDAATRHVGEWIAGRTLAISATFRRPARYLNAGVGDFERDLALGGTTLFGSVKSALLVHIVSRGSLAQEAAARVRQYVRGAVERWIAPHDTVSAGIVAAVLIGDRTGLPDDVRLRLQAAGTYHVIAISGGNIAILAAVSLCLLLVCGVAGRPAAIVTLVVLIAYACVVSSGASVWRATVMAAVYLIARALDHRSPPWQAIGVAAALVICARPLDVRDAGFLLTFGATAALLEAVRRSSSVLRHRPVMRWVVASVAASAAAEIALLPVSAWTFSRVTSAGLLLNLVAVPLMTIVQVGGMVVCALDRVGYGAALAGWCAHLAAHAIVSTSRLVDVAPWLSMRVPPPPAWLVLVYYGALGAALVRPPIHLSRNHRLWCKPHPWRRPYWVCASCVVAVLIAGLAIATGAPAWALPRDPQRTNTLRLTVFDVGQGDSMLVELPDGSTLLVDSGGIPFGSGTFDIGARVLAPALWARGIRRLDTLVLTHGDPDHIGGARSVIDDFRPERVWEGIHVPRHVAMRDLLSHARETGARVESRRSGDLVDRGGAHIRVLHPPTPDWERQRVRNDDSIVLEIVYGDVALLLAGDIGADVERAIVGQLTPARIRVLKVAHHGSRTSSSRELLQSWRPQIAIISCGRGNTFGHPAPDVVERLQAIGAIVYRTDLEGQVVVETDGKQISVRTFIGEMK